MSDQSTAGWFRTQPPDRPTHTIRRRRLLDIMSTRFDRPLTVLVGGAGHGKTTLLAQAMAENEHDPQGFDLWLCCNSHDRTPESFIAGLAATLGGAADTDQLDDVIDLLILRSPDSVALMIDDAHILDGSPSAAVLADLSERLPRNAHMVIASRTMPSLGIRRHQSSGAAVVIDQKDLSFTADERREVAESVGQTDDELPAWPALAMLTAALGHDAGVEYVWEEVLADLGADHRHRLATLALFEVVDDELAAAVLGPEVRTEDIVAGLPLVDRIGDEYRLHELWGDALRDVLDAETRAATHLTAARHYDAVGNLVAAGRSFAAAGAHEEVARLARYFITLPITGGLDRRVAEALLDVLPTSERNAALGRCLAALPRWHNGEPDSVLMDIDAEAGRIGDAEMQSLVRWRAIQRGLELSDPAWVIDDRLYELAEQGWPLARSALSLYHSYIAKGEGDIEAAIATIDDLTATDPATLFAARAAQMISLGRPEDVPVTLAEVLEEGASQAIAAQAVWLRGEIRAADAWTVAASLPSAYAQRGMADIEVPLLATVSSVGLAAGALDQARRFADEAAVLAAPTTRQNRLFAAVADAQCLLAEEGVAAAGKRFAEIIADHPVRPWPAWPLLSVLAPLRAFVPDAQGLDELRLGPSLALAVRAGRTAAEIRDGAPVHIAADLPWSSEALMEVHLPPPLRCELALAAADSNLPAAKALDQTPGRDRWLRRLLDHPNQALAELAEERISGQPARPDHDLRIFTFGDITVERSDGEPIGPVPRRGRLTQLFAIMIRERQISRTAAAERLWPDLDATKASNNLRVNLHKLLDLVQPDRGPDGSFWLRVDNERLQLADEGIDIDFDEFEQHLDSARQAEAKGAPSAADEHYAVMRDLYRGEYLAGLDDVELEPERMRLRSLAYAAVCRRAELALARGEPELATRHAVDAESIDQRSERAPRVQILALLAIGARSAALVTARQLVDRLEADGLRPEPDTQLVLDRLGRG